MYLFVTRPVEIPRDLASGCRTVEMDEINDENYRKAPLTVNPLLSPPEGLFISSPFEWGAGGGGLMEALGLFSLETTMVSVLHKELEYKVEKLKYKKF